MRQIGGGEFAVSYGILKELDRRLGDGDFIYVVSLTLTEDEVASSALSHVRLLEVEGQGKIDCCWKFKYLAWMGLAYRSAIKSGIRFDIVHLYSLSDFRMLGPWWKMDGCYKIFGPVGGGQECPKGLASYDGGEFAVARKVFNWYCRISPIYRRIAERYDRIYACNHETQEYFKNADFLIDCPLGDLFRDMPIPDRKNEKPVLLYCGRLIPKKGLMFLLDVVSGMQENFVLHVYGQGLLEAEIKNRIVLLGLEGKVIMKGVLPYGRMSEAYKGADILVLPSLRESGGSVQIEAMAHALPIVAPNISLSRMLSEKDVGLFVDMGGSKGQIIGRFRSALEKLIGDRGLRKKLGENGHRYVNGECTFGKVVGRIYGDLLQ